MSIIPDARRELQKELILQENKQNIQRLRIQELQEQLQLKNHQNHDVNRQLEELKQRIIELTISQQRTKAENIRLQITLQNKNNQSEIMRRGFNLIKEDINKNDELKNVSNQRMAKIERLKAQVELVKQEKQTIINQHKIQIQLKQNIIKQSKCSTCIIVILVISTVFLFLNLGMQAGRKNLINDQLHGCKREISACTLKESQEIIIDHRRELYFENETQFIQLIENVTLFPNVWRLSLRNKSITEQAIEKLFKKGRKYPILNQLDLSSNNLTDKSIISFALNAYKFQSLNSFSMFNNSISDDGLRALVRNASFLQTLERLDLSKNNISDDGFKVLAQSKDFQQLQVLHLQNNKISDFGLPTLIRNAKKFPKLQLLNLSNNRISIQGLQQLGRRIHKFKSIPKVLLNDNYIKDEELHARKWQL